MPTSNRKRLETLRYDVNDSEDKISKEPFITVVPKPVTYIKRKYKHWIYETPISLSSANNATINFTSKFPTLTIRNVKQANVVFLFSTDDVYNQYIGVGAETSSTYVWKETSGGLLLRGSVGGRLGRPLTESPFVEYVPFYLTAYVIFYNDHVMREIQKLSK